MEFSNLQRGALVKLSAGIYWYHEQRIDDLTDRPLLLLGFTQDVGGADGMTMDRGNRAGVATLLIGDSQRTVTIFGSTMQPVEA